MAREIEHPYPVKNALGRQGVEGTPYPQGYLSIDPERRFRVRAGGGRAFLTWCGILIRNGRKRASEWPIV